MYNTSLIWLTSLLYETYSISLRRRGYGTHLTLWTLLSTPFVNTVPLVDHVSGPPFPKPYNLPVSPRSSLPDLVEVSHPVSVLLGPFLRYTKWFKAPHVYFRRFVPSLLQNKDKFLTGPSRNLLPNLQPSTFSPFLLLIDR